MGGGREDPDLADLLMNEDSWERIRVGERLAAHVVAGVDEQNSSQRIRLLCCKLNAVSNDDIALHSLQHGRWGLIAEGHSMFPHDRSSVLLGSLTKAVRTAWDWMSATELFEATRRLPTGLVDRVRAWILAYAPDVDADTIAAELEHAIASRDATGDDVALVDQATELCNRTALRDRCQAALGDVPTVAEVSQALGADRPLPERWLRSHSWVAVLPSDMTEAWTVPCRVLATKYGEIRRENLLQRTPFEAQPVGSPIDTEELGRWSVLLASAASL